MTAAEKQSKPAAEPKSLSELPIEGALLVILDAVTFAREEGAFKSLDWDSTGALAAAIRTVHQRFDCKGLAGPEPDEKEG